MAFAEAVRCLLLVLLVDVESAVAVLQRSDGATDHERVAASLDALRKLGSDAKPAADTLTALLAHQSRLYADRDKPLVVRLRAYTLVTLSEIGLPPAALPPVLELLAQVDERMAPVEVGAAARAAGSLGPRGRVFAPHLVELLTLQRFSAEEFSLERYAPLFPEEEATTVQLEAIRSLGKISSRGDADVLAALRALTADSDPRVVREVRRAIASIEERP